MAGLVAYFFFTREMHLRRQRKLSDDPRIASGHEADERHPESRDVVVRRVYRPRLYRERPELTSLPDDIVYQRYRFPKDVILNIYELVKHDLEPKTRRGHAIPGVVKLMNCLHFFATGSFQHTSSTVSGVSQSAFSRSFQPVMDALKKHLPTFIKFPSGESELSKIKQHFYSKFRIPNVIGCIACTHIAICAPYGDPEIYINRNGWHSLNVQVVCDHNCEIIYVLSAFPGSTHDAYILRESALYRDFMCAESKSGCLLGKSCIIEICADVCKVFTIILIFFYYFFSGDMGFPCYNWLLTPIGNPQTASQIKYNEAHAKARVVVERAFSILKSRFRCLHKTEGALKYSPSKVADIVVVCCILHNIALQEKIPIEVEDISEEDMSSLETEDTADSLAATDTRDRIVSNYF
ncbi:mirror-image polydactyly gene 1 protein isoform X3 [Bombina bombina]|nr:mirror-image polydactyly gene 1 protein isoform X3 [Bombina bombina]